MFDGGQHESGRDDGNGEAVDVGHFQLGQAVGVGWLDHWVLSQRGST